MDFQCNGTFIGKCYKSSRVSRQQQQKAPDHCEQREQRNDREKNKTQTKSERICLEKPFRRGNSNLYWVFMFHRLWRKLLPGTFDKLHRTAKKRETQTSETEWYIRFDFVLASKTNNNKNTRKKSPIGNIV